MIQDIIDKSDFITESIEDLYMEQEASDLEFEINTMPLSEYITDEAPTLDSAMAIVGLSINTPVDTFINGNGKAFYIT